MVDPGKIVREWLLGTAEVTALLGTNQNGSIYVGDLPEKFDPAFGPGIQLTVTGGAGHGEIAQIVNVRVTLKTWAGQNQSLLARSVYRACYDVLHGANDVNFGDDGRVLTSQALDLGQDLADPETGWANVLSFFQLDIIQTAPASLSDFVNSTQTVQQYIDQQIALIAGMDDNL